MDRIPFPYRIGRIGRAHGLDGAVMVQLFRRRHHAGDPAAHRFRRLKPPMPVEVAYPTDRLEALTLTHVKWVDPIRLVARFAEIGDRDRAEARTGCYLDVEPDQLDPAIADPVDAAFGAEVIDADSGERLGSVVAIRDNGAQALLEVDIGAAEDALVPVVPELVVGIDVVDGRRTVRLRPIPGLLDG